MSRRPRGSIIQRKKPGIYHCWSRCVRRAFLCGIDRYSGKDFDHRRDWIEQRIEELARWFGIDVPFYAIMENHFHLVLRTWPTLVAVWTNRQIIERSSKIFPSKFKDLGVKKGQPTRAQIRKFAADSKLVKQLRSRLADPSWFLRQLKQSIATRANAEDQVKGHFFEGRFDCKVVVDQTGLLMVGLYVDLNQIRSKEASRIEKSKRTSAYRRHQALLRRRQKKRGAAAFDGFLPPIHVAGDGQTEGYTKAGTLHSQRVSDRGLLDMTVEQNLQLLDWFGRQIRRDKRGSISAKIPPILEELELDAESLLATLEDFEAVFRHAIGSPQAVSQFRSKLRRTSQAAAK